MQIDSQAVISDLSEHIRTLIVENAILRQQVRALEQEVKD